AQSRDRSEVERPSVLQVEIRERQRCPDVGARRELESARELGTTWKGEARPCNANHRGSLTTQGDWLAENGRIASPPSPPQRVADDDDLRRAGKCIGVGEVASDRRPRAERRKERRRGLDTRDLLRATAFAEGVRPGAKRGTARE